jgi:hypothetical protein
MLFAALDGRFGLAASVALFAEYEAARSPAPPGVC